MRLSHVEILPSPLGREQVRLSGDVQYDTPGRAPDQLWFDVHTSLSDGLSTSGNPWLAALLPLAVTLREPLQLCRAVDPALREGAEALMRVWSAWYPDECQVITIECDVLSRAPDDAGGRTAALFSGGVDSFYTLLRHAPGGGALDPLPIDDLLTVWGFDIPLEAADAFADLERSVGTVARALGKTSVTIATNLRESGWNVANWGKLSQGPALAAVGLALEGRYRRVLIPSSIPYHSFKPWGTHPLTDPLLSTSGTEIRNDGALMRRVHKLASLLDSPLALEHLHVCWMGRSAANCGRCEKCLRTLTIFELLGARDRAVAFPAGAWSLDAVSNLRLRHDLDRDHLQRAGLLARDQGRADVVRAINRAVRRYSLRRSAARVARMLGLR